MAWLSSGRLTNPTSSQVLVDTGQLPAGDQRVQVIIASSVAAVCEAQLRNAADDTTLKSQIVAVPANGIASAVMPDNAINPPFQVAQNERIRIILVTGITGSFSASLFYAG